MGYTALPVEGVVSPLSLHKEESEKEKKQGERERRSALVSNLDCNMGDYRKEGLQSGDGNSRAGGP